MINKLMYFSSRTCDLQSHYSTRLCVFDMTTSHYRFLSHRYITFGILLLTVSLYRILSFLGIWAYILWILNSHIESAYFWPAHSAYYIVAVHYPYWNLSYILSCYQYYPTTSRETTYYRIESFFPWVHFIIVVYSTAYIFFLLYQY